MAIEQSGLETCHMRTAEGAGKAGLKRADGVENLIAPLKYLKYRKIERVRLLASAPKDRASD